jgi:NAD(P)-dependent dehydrogenase (short-subunit alcohol dehydrogenase family)
VDLCDQLETVAYPMATPEDLAETVAQVEALDRRIVARQADVRDLAALTDVVTAGTSELGPIDVVVANAGIAPQGGPEPDMEAMFRSVVEVNLIGVWNTVMAAVPSMREKGKGGAIVLTSSTQGLKGTGGDGSAAMRATPRPSTAS